MIKKTTTNNIELFNVKALLYGKPGTGKTHSALTLNPERTLVISAEGGLLPLAGTKIDVIELKKWNI